MISSLTLLAADKDPDVREAACSGGRVEPNPPPRQLPPPDPVVSSNSGAGALEQHCMEQTACFRRESTKQTCMSQCDKNDDIQIVTESLDTDTTSMLVGEGLSCS